VYMHAILLLLFLVIWSKTDTFGHQSCLCRYIKNISANFQEWMANSLKTDAKVGCYELS